MLALRYAALLALAVWVGGLIALGGVTAPALFATLGAAGAEGRAAAGAAFGEVLRRFHLIGYACAAVILLSLLARAVLGPRPRRFAIRLAIAGLMLMATAVVGLVLAPRIAGAQRAGELPSTLPHTDERRAAFARMHRLSAGLELVPLAGGLALLFWELKD